jgi:L-alanine-DL-glutamate epimerase-like enolase superfamily enzyme
MRITGVVSWRDLVPLSQPYEISTMRIDAVDLLFVRITTNEGFEGVGSASPAEDVTGETPDACAAALNEKRMDWLLGRDPRSPDDLLRELAQSHSATPAARAAIDMALYDLAARIEGVPLVDLLGRCHDALPTSVTIGISSAEETIAQAEEYLGHGFRCLKVKTGRSFEEDIERLAVLRERVGPEIAIRIDANQGCSLEEARRLGSLAGDLALELVEQPLPATSDSVLRSLPWSSRRIIAADESLHGEDDAIALAGDPPACGIFNIKLMKCGGIRPALAIADIAESVGINLMWGCNDESVVSIAAALHAAFSVPNTRFLDLDGSFDLARDPARGGFAVEEGRMRLLERPGLGVDFED